MGFAPSSLQLTSPAFQPLGRIPKKHTGEADDVSPALAWSNVPAGTYQLTAVATPTVFLYSGETFER